MAVPFMSDMSMAILLPVVPVPPMMVSMMMPAFAAFMLSRIFLAVLSQPIPDIFLFLPGQILLHWIILVMPSNRLA